VLQKNVTLTISDTISLSLRERERRYAHAHEHRILASAQTAVVNLGAAGNYVILAKTGISTAPTSDITGDIGVSPIAATAITGFSLIMDAGNQYSTSSTSSQLSDTCQAHAASYGGPVATTLAIAVSDMIAAYSDAARRDGETAKCIGAGYLGPVEGSNAKPLAKTSQSLMIYISVVTRTLMIFI
jgi:hypothetical protein